MNPDRKQFIADLRGRAALLFPGARERLTAFLQKAEENGTPENVKKLIELKRAAISNGTALQDLNRLRILSVENLIVPMSNAGSFFRSISLQQDEEPMLENTTGQEMKARFIGEDGKPHMTQILKNLARKLIELGWVSTRILEYPLVDVYRGQVGQDVLNAAPMARDLALAIDQQLWKLIKALPVAAWVQTGPPASRTFVLHSTIIAANVPVGNLLDMSAQGAFNFEVIKAIVKFYMQMGNIFDGVTSPEAIFVPSIDVGSFIDALTLTSNSLNPAVQQIFTDGYVTNLGGKQIVIVGDAQLDPALGLAYVRTNKPIGEWYTKPSMDISYPENPSQISEAAILENKGRAFIKKVFGAVTPLPWTVNMLAVKYK
jgi:hypothetical protein